MKLKLFLILLLITIYYRYSDAISLVYNMRIRRVFTLDTQLAKGKKSRLGLSAVPIVYARDRDIDDDVRAIDVHEKRIIGGSLLNLRYLNKRAWWFEATTGIEKEHVKSRGTQNFSASRVGCDDIVLSAGYNIFPHPRIQLVPFAIGGMPTRTKINALEAQDTLVGTRFFSLGFGSEFSYRFFGSEKQSLIAIFQARFLHFFNRSWEPILPAGGRIQPGNVTDLLISLQYRYKRNFIETGYNPTFFTNQALFFNNQTFKGKDFVRHSFYASYARLLTELSMTKRAFIIGAGLNIGRSDRFNTKIIAGWLNLGIVF